jgi:hypothetical protein
MKKIVCFVFINICKVSRGIEPLKKVLTVPRFNHSAIRPALPKKGLFLN